MKFFKKNYPIIILSFLIFLIFFPILFLKKLFPGSDLLLVFYPYSHYFINSQSFWTSGILSGFNMGATPAGFSGNWIYYFAGIKFFNFITFYNILILFYFILAAFFSYLVARLLEFDKYVSVLIVSIYIFSVYNLSWMVNIVTAPSLFIFPAIIYFLIKFKNSQNWLWPISGGIAIGFGLIMSHPQFSLIAIFGGFLFSIFLVFSFNDNRGRFSLNKESLQWKFLVAFLAILIVGISLSAFQLIPEYRASQLAQRGLALNFAESQECALGVADFIRFIIPNFNFGVNCESLLYVGILPLILAILSVIYLIKNKDIIFWLLLLIFALLFSIKYSPLAWIFHQLPIWSVLRGPARFVMLSNFALAVLSGYGFNWILENKENFNELKIFYWINKAFLWLLTLIISINIIGIFKSVFIKWAQDFFDKYYYSKTIGLPIDYYHRSIENLISNNFYVFSFLNKEFLIPLVLATAAFLVLFFIKKFNKTSLFFVFILSGFAWAITSPMVSSGLNRDFFKETPVINFLKQQKKTFRIYSLMPGLSAYQLVALNHTGATEDDQNEFLKIMLPPNLNMIYGLDSIDGYDVSMPRRTARILAELLSERAPIGNKIANARFKPEEKIKIFENRRNILSMMNVKYIISAFPLDDKIFKRVFETETTRFNIPVYIYENKNVLPRFYFAKSIKSISSNEEGVSKTMLAPDINFNDFSFIECGNNCGKNSSGKIIDYEYKNGYLRLNTESQTGGWFIFSESFDHNWKAKINNLQVPIYRANYVYQAVKVPAGKNTIEFIFNNANILK